jgi:hypothetical protein
MSESAITIDFAASRKPALGAEEDHVDRIDRRNLPSTEAVT